MPRLRQVARRDAGTLATKLYDLLFPGRDPVAEPGTSTGTPGNWWTVFALVPDCLQHAVDGFRFYRDPARKLDPALRELAQTRAGFARGTGVHGRAGAGGRTGTGCHGRGRYCPGAIGAEHVLPTPG
ncbi:MAG: hypothetical protein KDI33_08215, partial [Halioglobus sp.]|nr:hypothetical protein [Halioglobus sp.]